MSAAPSSSAIPEEARDDALSDCALDALLYAPVGFALFIREQAPNFVKLFAARGRAELGGAPGPGGATPDVRRLVADGIALLRECAEEFKELVRVGDEAAAPPDAPAAAAHAAAPPATAPTREPAPAPRPEPVRSSEPEEMVAGDVIPADVVERDIGVAELAIPDYDQLSASQVLPRLEGLDPSELEAIRRYELEHRARSSVLAKVDQLTG